MTQIVKPQFQGAYKELLEELAGVIEELSHEHETSFVKAGDDRVYAFGGNGFALVLDESGWAGLIEVLTPNGALSLKPDGDGRITVTSAVEGEAAIKNVLRAAIDGLLDYYANRYWTTPSTQ